VVVEREGRMADDRVEIVLRGAAAGDAQHLAAKLMDLGLVVSPLEVDNDAERSPDQLAVDVVVGLLVNAAYDVVATYVREWLASRNHSMEAGEVRPLPDNEDQDPGRLGEPRSDNS
jgi:hypothetical protein